jgi:hypothetical protein
MARNFNRDWMNERDSIQKTRANFALHQYDASAYADNEILQR